MPPADHKVPGPEQKPGLYRNFTINDWEFFCLGSEETIDWRISIAWMDIRGKFYFIFYQCALLIVFLPKFAHLLKKRCWGSPLSTNEKLLYYGCTSFKL
jgi:hypothetical protein